jgi:hypothetical protein
MGESSVLHLDHTRQARECRRIIETLLDLTRWRWCARTSALIDFNLAIEDGRVRHREH